MIFCNNKKGNATFFLFLQRDVINKCPSEYLNSCIPRAINLWSIYFNATSFLCVTILFFPQTRNHHNSPTTDFNFKPQPCHIFKNAIIQHFSRINRPNNLSNRFQSQQSRCHYEKLLINVYEYGKKPVRMARWVMGGSSK